MSPKRVSVGEEGGGNPRRGAGGRKDAGTEPTVASLVRGIWMLRVSEAEQRVREGVYKMFK